MCKEKYFELIERDFNSIVACCREQEAETFSPLLWSGHGIYTVAVHDSELTADDVLEVSAFIDKMREKYHN